MLNNYLKKMDIIICNPIFIKPTTFTLLSLLLIEISIL